MSKFDIICNVRSNEQGIDAETFDHGVKGVEASSALEALKNWITAEGEASYVSCSLEAFDSLLVAFQDNDSSASWDSQGDGNDNMAADWFVGYFEFWDESSKLMMSGSTCCGEWDFEVTVQLAAVPKEACDGCTVPVMKISELSRDDLEEIVRYSLHGLYMWDDAWTLDREISGSDYIEHMANILNHHALVPEEE